MGRAKKRKSATRRKQNGWHWYLKGVFFAIVAVMLSACCCWPILFPAEQPVAEEESQIPKPDPLRFLLLLESGFEPDCLAVAVLADYQPQTGLLQLGVLPADLGVGETSLKEAYEVGRAGRVQTLLEEVLGLKTNAYLAFSAMQLYSVTHRYGNLLYRLEEPISRYDPKTGQAFLGAKGPNQATGLDFCKLTDLTIEAEIAEGCNLTASRLGSYLTGNLRTKTPTREGFAALLGLAETNLSQSDFDRIAPALTDLLERGMPQVVIIDGARPTEDAPFRLAEQSFAQLSQAFGTPS